MRLGILGRWSGFFFQKAQLFHNGRNGRETKATTVGLSRFLVDRCEIVTYASYLVTGVNLMLVSHAGPTDLHAHR